MLFGDEAVGEALDEIMSGEFDLLLGRRTYEIFAAYWPYDTEEMSERREPPSCAPVVVEIRL